MLAEAVLMGIPDKLKQEALAGTIYRVGALLFRKGEPGIVGHITEAGGLAPAVGLSALREREAMAASAPLTIRRLGQVGIDGRAWLEKARQETSEPLLILAGEAFNRAA